METGYLPVIGLLDVMCHMAESPGKVACKVKCGWRTAWRFFDLFSSV